MDRQARKAKRDYSDEIGGQKGECVNNFVADCPKYNSSNESTASSRVFYLTM